MWKRIRLTVAMLAFISGASLIVHAQSGPGAARNISDVSRSRVAPSTSGDSRATGTTQGKSSAQDLAGSSSAGSSGIDCPPPLVPPYNAQPVKPPRLPPCR
jgi:hypothetical protein